VHVVYKGNNRIFFKKMNFFCEILTSLQYKCVNKQTNMLSPSPSPSPKCFQSPSPRTSEKSADSDSDSDVRKALLNRHCDAQIDIGIRADELGNNRYIYFTHSSLDPNGGKF
jgi:hypothetical protein